MWISRKRFNELEKKVADLEGQVQGQQTVKIDVNECKEVFEKAWSRVGKGSFSC